MKKLMILLLVLALVLTGCRMSPEGMRQAHGEAEAVPETAVDEPVGTPVDEPVTEPTGDGMLPHEQTPSTQDPEEPEEPEIREETDAQRQPQPQPQPTPAPVDPLATAKGRYTVNIFLSNFSEQGFHHGAWWPTDTASKFITASADPMEMISFAWLNGKINENACEFVEYQGESYYGIDMTTIDALTYRYFGRHVSASDVYPIEKGGYWFFQLIDGKLCCLAADGDTYNALTVTDSLTALGDGTYRADFHVYSVEITGDDSLVSIGGTVTDKTLYELTAAQAASHWGLAAMDSGTAVIRPYTTPGGTATYQLVSYQIYQ